MKRKADLLQVVDEMEHTRVLVVGDLMLDSYLWCDVKRISPEAPVPIASVTGESCFLGGAANVANNIRALDAQVSIIGVIGDDKEGKMVKQLLEEKGINSDSVIVVPQRQTTLKNRVVSGTQQLLRIDRETTENIHKDVEDQLLLLVPGQLKDCDLVVISDYCKGLVTDKVIDTIKKEAGKQGKRILVDSKNRHLLKFSDVYLVKPNKEEAEVFAEEKFEKSYSNLEEVIRKLSGIFKSNIVVTLGADGVAVLEDGVYEHKTTRAKQVFDVSGAGDTVLAVIAAAVGAKASLNEAVDLSNIAAGYVVSCLGTSVCGRQILREYLNELKK